MAFREGRNACGIQSGSPELLEEVGSCKFGTEVTRPPFDKLIPSGSAMTDCPVMDAEHPAGQRTSGRQARCVRTIIPVKNHAFLCDAINIRGRIPEIPIASEVVRTKGIQVKKYNSHRLISFLFFYSIPLNYTIRPGEKQQDFLNSLVFCMCGAFGKGGTRFLERKLCKELYTVVAGWFS